MEDRPWTKYWIKHSLAHPLYGKMKLKKLNVGYPRFQIDPSIMEIVDYEEFKRIEDHRIPLFIGTQFGVAPRVQDLDNFCNEEKLVANLPK